METGKSWKNNNVIHHFGMIDFFGILSVVFLQGELEIYSTSRFFHSSRQILHENPLRLNTCPGLQLLGEDMDLHQVEMV